MAIEAAKLQVKVESNALTVSGEVEQLGQKVKGAGETGSQGLGTLTKGFNALQSQVLPAAAIVTGFAATVKKTYEFGEEGAQIEQLKESASALAESMGSSLDDIVDAVDEAVNHTIDQASIVKSAATAMLLGVSADADQLANLAEIAAARARDVGETTSQAFDDIVRGIGRQSPLILDNLGIVVDADSAYRTYAASVGKSSDALTENEKKQALLNDVLDAGNKLLADTGGLTVTNATKYEQASARITDAMDKVKEKIAPFWADVAEGLAGVMGYRDEIADMNQEFTGSAIKSGDSYDAYITKALSSEEKYSSLAGSLLKEWNELQKAKADGTTWSSDATFASEYLDKNLSKLGLMTEQTYLAKAASDSWVTSWQKNNAAVTDLATSVTRVDSVTKAGLQGELKSIYEDYQAQMEDLQSTQENLAGSVDYFAAQYESAPAKIEELTAALADNKQAQMDCGHTSGILVTKQQELETELTKWNNVLKDGKGNIEAYNEKLSDSKKKQDDLKAATEEAVRQMLFQQLSAGLTGEAYYTLAEKMGLIDEDSYNAALSAQALKDQYDKGTISAGEYATKADELATAIAELKSKSITITVTTINRTISENETAAHSLTLPTGQVVDLGQYTNTAHDANGYDGVVPAGNSNDDYFFSAFVKSGERIQITPPGQKPMINNNNGGDTYNLYFEEVGATAADIERTLRQSRRRG
mgnify:CR=1 FL=1